MYPEADIPCIQLSLVDNLSPAAHVGIGRAIQDLEYENLLIIGSGFSFHNMKAFFSSETSESKTLNESFEAWLLETCTNSSITEEEREQRFIQWEKAPDRKSTRLNSSHVR